jgi:hypothetical protein
MDAALLAADPASPWMKHLERAHDLAHVAARAIGEESTPSAHLAPAARRLEIGIAAMYDAFDGRADRSTAINLAHGRLWDAAILTARAGLPRALAALREACRELVQAEERFPRVPLAERVTKEIETRADLPPLHAIERASMAPSFSAPDLPEPEDEVAAVALPEPTTFAELAATAKLARQLAEQRPASLAQRKERPTVEKPAPVAPPPGFAEPPPAAVEDEEFIRRWARECFDEIGMLGVQRLPLAGDDWRTSLPIERRMIHAVDAIAALGPPAIASLEPLALDAPIANPMSVFAIALLGGCLEGRDALGGAERALHHFGPTDPIVAEPFAAAMKLAPNPFLPGALRSLLASTEIGCRAIGIDVLGYRGWLTNTELAELADEEDPGVLAHVLPALAAARHPDLGRALARAQAHDDLRVQEAALAAMALAAHPKASSAARAAATGALGDRALVHLAIVASEDDARWLLDRMNASPTAAAVEAVGWAGLTLAIPALIDLLDAEDEAIKLVAGAALERLLGAKMVESIEVPPEALDDTGIEDPDPDAADPRRPLAELVSDPRFMPPASSTEKLEVASIDPQRWRAYWSAHGSRYDPEQRLRRGNPYSPSVSLHELDRLPLSPGDRRCLHRELAARTGKLTHFDPHDFVLVQEQSLAAWGALVKATAEVPGSWARPGAR